MSGPACCAACWCVPRRRLYTLHTEVRHSSCVRACTQTTATAAPDCNTSSSSSRVVSRRWSRVLAPQGVNPALAVAVGMMFHTQQQQHGRYHSVRKYNPILVDHIKTKLPLHFRRDGSKEYHRDRLFNVMLVLIFVPQ